MQIVINSEGDGDIKITAGKEDKARDIEFIALAFVSLWRKLGGNQGSFRKYWKAYDEYEKQLNDHDE